MFEMSFVRSVLFGAALGCGMMFGHHGAASVLSLDTGKSVSVAPGATSTFTFSVTNSTGDISVFEGWTLGIQILPSGATTGTVTPQSVAVAATSPLPSSSFSTTQPNSLALSAPINDSSTYWEISILGNATETALSGQTYNLGGLVVSASANAAGTWNVYAVQESAIKRSYWTNSSFLQEDYGNLQSGVTPSRTIGTITVTPVPEPSTAGLLVVALGAASIVRRRNRCQRGRVEPKKESKAAFSGSHGVGV